MNLTTESKVEIRKFLSSVSGLELIAELRRLSPDAVPTIYKNPVDCRGEGAIFSVAATAYQHTGYVGCLDNMMSVMNEPDQDNGGEVKFIQ